MVQSSSKGKLKGRSLSSTTSQRDFTIVGVTHLEIAKRLFAMGVLPGTSIRLIRQSPFFGTCYVKAGDFSLALRKEEADAILVK